MIVYKATNKLNGEFYIGITKCSLEVRMKGHIYGATQRKLNLHFYNAISKYGSKNFEWQVIDIASSYEELLQLEIRYIAALKPHYNMTRGGEGAVGVVLTPESSVRRSASNWAKKMKGKLHHTQDAKDRISNSMKGMKKSPQHLEAIAKALTGKPLSVEHREKIKQAWQRWRERNVTAQR